MSVLSLQGYRGKLVAGNNVVLDLYKDEEILVSNNSTELFDLGAVPATYSKSILLPGTKLNNEFFQQYFDFSIDSPNTWISTQKVRAYFDFDGIYLVDGYVQLNKVNLFQNKFVDSYEITLFGIISNIGVDLKRLFLTDLSVLSKYNHTASWDNVSSSWAGNLFNGDVVYQLADAGQQYYYAPGELTGIDEYVAAVNVQDLKPAVRVKAVWDAVFKQSGYTYTGSFWNQGWLDDVYLIANNNKKTLIVNGDELDNYGAFKITAQNSSSITTTGTDYSFTSLNFLNKESDTSYKYDQTTGVYHLDKRTPLRGKVRLNFQVSGSITKANQRSVPQGFAIWARDAATNTMVDQVALAKINNLYSDAVKTSFRTSQVSADTGNTSVQYLQDFDLEESFMTSILPSGSYKFSLYVYQGTSTDVAIKLDRTENPKSYFEINKVDWIADGKIVDIPGNMPYGESGVKLIDFVTGLQKKFNLVMYQDKTKPNQLVCETFNNWYKNAQIKVIDGYVNQESPIIIEPLNQYSVNKVSFSDKEQKDYIPEVFKRAFSRQYGTAFYQDSQSYYSQGEFKIETAFGSAPLVKVPGSFTTASFTSGSVTCYNYKITNDSDRGGISWTYYPCGTGTPTSQSVLSNRSVTVCSAFTPIPNNSISSLNGYVTKLFACGTYTGSIPVAAGIVSGSDQMFIPYYIANEKYEPARVSPRLMFYNGMKSVQPWHFRGSGSLGEGINTTFNTYPYFDNYRVANTTEGPNEDSLSLLFNNEYPSFGTLPKNSLINSYWSNYLDLYYNPKGKVLSADAIIPLADYFDIELNDLAFLRGNYYHIRAINEYNLTTGECKLQLIGPILPDVLAYALGYVPNDSTPTGSVIPVATASVKLAEFNNSPASFLDANLFVSGTSYFFSGDYTQYITGGDTANVTLEVKDVSPTIWGAYTTGSAKLQIYDNGILVSSSINVYYSGSGDKNYTLPMTFGTGRTISITGSTEPVAGVNTANLAWTFTDTAASATMDLYVNGVNVTSQNTTSTGNVLVEVGDVIYAEIIVIGCSGGTAKANAYTYDIINDADCQDGSVDLITNSYTVQPGDVGTTLSLRMFAKCLSACL